MKIRRSEPLNPYQFHDVQIGLVDRLFVKGERGRPGFYRQMFDDDFSRIFSAAANTEDKHFDIITNDDSLLEKLLGNTKTRYRGRTEDEIIRILTEEIAQSMIRFGTAYYYLYEDSEQDKIRIVPVESVNIIHFFDVYFQWVPKRREKHLPAKDHQLPREIRLLNSDKILHYKMPITLKRMLAIQSKTLAVIDQHRFGPNDFHAQPSYENPYTISHFDFNLWNDNQERALFRATRRTGWNARNTRNAKCSDFFNCHRLIRFRRNQLILRDYILRQLSCEFSRVGKGYNSKFTVQITLTENSIKISHLNKLENQLRREEVGFTEILNYCYKL